MKFVAIILLSCLTACIRGYIRFGPRRRFNDRTPLDGTVASNIFSEFSGVPGNCNVSTQNAPLGSLWHSLSIVDEPRVPFSTTVQSTVVPYHKYADRTRPTIMFSDGSTQYVPQRESQSTVWYMYPRIGAPMNFAMEPATDLSDEPGWFTNFRPHYLSNRNQMDLVYTSGGLECIESPTVYRNNSFYSGLEGVHTAFPAPHLSPHLPQADIVICDKLDRFIVITTSFSISSLTYNRVHSIVEASSRFPWKNGDWGINAESEVVTSLPTGHSPRSCMTADLSAGISGLLDDPLRSHHVVLVGTDNGQQIEDWVPHHNTWVPVRDFDYEFDVFAEGDKTDISHFTRGSADPIVREEGGDLRRAVFVDIDGDGDQDLLVAAGPSLTVPYSHVMLVEARPGATDGVRHQYVTTHRLDSSRMGECQFVVATDVDGDGFLDVVALGSSHLVWFQRDAQDAANVLFHDPAVISSDGDIVAAYGLVATDIDGDGDDDLIVTRGANDVTLVYESTFSDTGSITSPFNMAFALPIGDAIPLGSDRALAVGDMDGDGDTDVVVTSDGPDIESWGLYYYENMGPPPTPTSSPTSSPTSAPTTVPTNAPTSVPPFGTTNESAPVLASSSRYTPLVTTRENLGAGLTPAPQVPDVDAQAQGDSSNLFEQAFGPSTWWVALIFMFTTTCLLCIVFRFAWTHCCSQKPSSRESEIEDVTIHVGNDDSDLSEAEYSDVYMDDTEYFSDDAELSQAEATELYSDTDLPTITGGSMSSLFVPQSRPRLLSHQSSGSICSAASSQGSQTGFLGRHGRARHDDEEMTNSDNDSWVSDDDACAIERRKLSKRHVELLSRQTSVKMEIKTVGVLDRIDSFFGSEEP